MSERYMAGIDMEKAMWAFPTALRKEYGNAVGWRCEHEGCKRSFSGGFKMEAHHIVPEVQAKKMGWSEAQINAQENCAILCLQHHMSAHYELNDWNGARLIDDRIKASGIMAHNHWFP